MVKRRKMLVGLGALAAGGITATGTGAFTNVEADRKMTVQTPHERDALLALEPEDGPNGQYIHTEDGTIKFHFGLGGTITDAGGYGLNRDAETGIRNMFKITNKGTQTVDVSVSGLPSGVTLVHDDPEHASWSDGPELEPGETLNNIGMIFDTSNLGHFNADVQITAEAANGGSPPA